MAETLNFCNGNRSERCISGWPYKSHRLAGESHQRGTKTSFLEMDDWVICWLHGRQFAKAFGFWTFWIIYGTTTLQFYLYNCACGNICIHLCNYKSSLGQFLKWTVRWQDGWREPIFGQLKSLSAHWNDLQASSLFVDTPLHVERVWELAGQMLLPCCLIWSINPILPISPLFWDHHHHSWKIRFDRPWAAMGQLQIFRKQLKVSLCWTIMDEVYCTRLPWKMTLKS